MVNQLYAQMGFMLSEFEIPVIFSPFIIKRFHMFGLGENPQSAKTITGRFVNKLRSYIFDVECFDTLQGHRYSICKTVSWRNAITVTY